MFNIVIMFINIPYTKIATPFNTATIIHASRCSLSKTLSTVKTIQATKLINVNVFIYVPKKDERDNCPSQWVVRQQCPRKLVLGLGKHSVCCVVVIWQLRCS